MNSASLITLLKLLYSGYSIILSICSRSIVSQILMCLSTDFSTSFLFNFYLLIVVRRKAGFPLVQTRELAFCPLSLSCLPFFREIVQLFYSLNQRIRTTSFSEKLQQKNPLGFIPVRIQ